MEVKDKKVVSPFEFAIMQIADPEQAKQCRPETRAEQKERIENKIRSFVSKIKTK